MDRRRFLLTSLAGALAAPLAAPAQPRRAIIGVLHVSAVADAPAFPAFRDGLRDLGYVEGKNVVLDYRWPHDRPEQLSSLAAALVQSKVDIIVAGDPTTALAAKRATTEIPIVVAVLAIDPVKASLVTSLARPGGRFGCGLTCVAGGSEEGSWRWPRWRAARRGCREMHLDTQSYQAPDFYRRRGYEAIGELPRWPDQTTRIFLRKTSVRLPERRRYGGPGGRVALSGLV